MRRCAGKQTPVVPHKQRLLVASIKDAKTEGKTGKKDPNAVKDPKKPPKKPPVKKGEGVDGGGQPDAPKRKTPYAEAKDLFLEKPLGPRSNVLQ